MNNDIKKRIDTLTKLINKEEKGLSSSLNKALVFYLIIVVFLSAYTIFLNLKIKELATPTNLAVEINSQVRAAIPRFNQQVKAQMEPGAREMAIKSVEGLRNMIPVASGFAKNQISFYLDEMLNSLEHNHLAALDKIFAETLNKALKDMNVSEDEKLAKAITSEVSKKLDKEIAGIVNHSFLNAMNEFRDEIDHLRLKSPNKLTKKEQTEKMFIAYWLFLVEHREIGNGVISGIANLSNVALEALEPVPVLPNK